MTGGHTATALKNMGLGNLSADDTDALFAFMDPHGRASKDRASSVVGPSENAFFVMVRALQVLYYLVREDRHH